MQTSAPFTCLAVDLGAESGRVAAVTLDQGRLHWRLLNRFEHKPLQGPDGLHWDLPLIWQGTLDGLSLAARAGLKPASVGVDGWGVDHAWAGPDASLARPPYSYRDPRGAQGLEAVLKDLDRDSLYRLCGLPPQPFSTLSQCRAHALAHPQDLQGGRQLLLLPDLLHARLSGRRVAERSNASTTQLYGAAAGDWHPRLLQAAGLQAAHLPPILPEGSLLGPLLPELEAATGLRGVRVVLPATHDTASAVAAVPATGAADWAFLSSGTWSLLGLELPAPLLDPAAGRAGFSNEAGVEGSTRFLKNITGLWLLQRLRLELAPQLDYPALLALAEDAEPLAGVFDAADPSLLNPPSMAAAIRALCRQAGQPEPRSLGALLRASLEALALEYRWTLGQLRAFSGRPVSRLYIVGGGSRNALLCQMSADACQVQVLAGPSEATCLGNALVQAKAMGRLASVAEGRALLAHSAVPTLYRPQDPRPWDAAFDLYRRLKEA